MKKAVIVAAGLSSRLYPLTNDLPKCLLEINGQKIIERNVALLKKYGIEEIYIVTGYLKEKIEYTLGDSCSYIFNPFYIQCNNMGSLFMTKPYVNNESFLYMHGDIIFSEQILKDFLQASDSKDSAISLSVDFKETDEEAMKVRVTEENYLIESNKEISLEDSAGEWIGLAAIKNPKAVFTKIEEVLQNGLLHVYDTFAFTKMAEDGHRIICIPTEGENWMEIDFLEDYETAKRMFE